jgi:diguanylate cyclase (GGDEF)-like protein/PAS domain S-box-containing protein
MLRRHPSQAAVGTAPGFLVTEMARSALIDTIPGGALPDDALDGAGQPVSDAAQAARPPQSPADPGRESRTPSRTDHLPVGLPGRRRMAQALFAAGGALAAYPGPAAAIGPGDLVLAANDAAEKLLDTLLGKRSGELRLALDSALAGAPAQLQPLLLPLGNGPGGSSDQTALELLVLPFPEADAALLLGRDVTLERTLRAALVDSRQRYKDLVEASSDFVWETGPDGRFVFVSPGGALGYRAEELIGRRPEEFAIDAEAGASEPGFPFTARSTVAKVELWFRAASGEPACLVASTRPVQGPDGAWKGTRGACQDVTGQRSREAELARLRHRERLLAYLVRTIRYEVDPKNAATAAASAALPALAAEGCRVHRLNDTRFAAVTECGNAAPAAEAQALAALIGGESRFDRVADGQALIAVPIRHGRRLSGALVLWRTAGLGAWDEDDLFLVAELADQLGVALQQIASQEALATLSRTDSLTGLVNRRSFVGELEQRLAGTGSRRGALLYLDLDNFKPINDRLGHASGDAVLTTVARLLRDCTRGSDLVGRLGGDEFVAWLADIDEAAASAKAREILRRVAQDLAPLSATDGEMLGASIGIALVSAPGTSAGTSAGAGADADAGSEDADALIARADGAMYAAKRGGKQRFVIAPPAGATAAAR